MSNKELAERIAIKWFEQGKSTLLHNGWGTYDLSDLAGVIEAELAAAEPGSILETVREERDYAWIEVMMLKEEIEKLRVELTETRTELEAGINCVYSYLGWGQTDVLTPAEQSSIDQNLASWLDRQFRRRVAK